MCGGGGDKKLLEPRSKVNTISSCAVLINISGENIETNHDLLSFVIPLIFLLIIPVVIGVGGEWGDSSIPPFIIMF